MTLTLKTLLITRLPNTGSETRLMPGKKLDDNQNYTLARNDDYNQNIFMLA